MDSDMLATPVRTRPLDTLENQVALAFHLVASGAFPFQSAAETFPLRALSVNASGASTCTIGMSGIEPVTPCLILRVAGSITQTSGVPGGVRGALEALASM